MFRMGSGLCIRYALVLGALSFFASSAAEQPSPEIEKLIQQCLQADKNSLSKAVEKLAAQGGEAERALNWHLKKDAASRVRYAELLARCGFGKVGYRVILELQPDGSGVVTMESNRALLADCTLKYARIMGQPEPTIDEDVLRYNPYSKVELIKHMNEGMKFQEGRVESHGKSISAIGVVSFKNFDSYAAFGQSFDPDGYNMLSPSSLSDGNDALRTFQYKTVAESDKQQFEKNILLFHDVSWEFVLDFKGRVTRHNAAKFDGSKLIWNFNCYQMLSGEAVVQASFDAAGLASRKNDKDTVTLPNVIQANQPIAIVKQEVIRARVYSKQPGVTPTTKDLRERGELVELDGRNSLPQGAALEYRWTQVFGPDLNINPADLAKPWVCLIVKEPGEYRFELTVSLNNIYSKPVEVKVIVTDDKPAQPVTPAKTEPVEPAKKSEPQVAKPEVKPEAIKPPETQVVKAPEPKPELKNDPPKVAQQEPKKTEPEKTASKPAPENKTPENKSVEPAVAQDPEKAKQRYEEAQILLKQFKYAEAKPILQHAAALSPDNNEIKFDLAATQFELHEYSDALQKFMDVATASRNAKAYMYIGHCQARLKNMQDAARAYRQGYTIGKEAVQWESRWQMANAELEEKNYKDALQDLKEVDEMARKASVKDYRLLRDLALAAHGSGKDTEALGYIKELQALGYTPDPQFAADVLHGTGGKKPTPEVAQATENKTTATQTTAKTDEPKKEEPKKTEAGSIVDLNKGNEVATANSRTIPEPSKKTESAAPAKTETPAPAKTETPAPEKKNETPVKSDPPKKPAVTPEKTSTEPKKIEPAKTETKPPVKPEPAKTDVVVKNDPTKPIEPTKPAVAATQPKKSEPKKTTPKPQIPKKPLPPIPNEYDQCVAAGKKAMDEGSQLSAKTDDESKQKAAQSFDEAEAMFRGAWDLRPGDDAVLNLFRELSKNLGAIAIPRTTHVKSKVNGLTVLDASLSIVGKDRPMYVVWEQVDGEDLGQRPEKLAQKVVGIKIPRAGMYKFTLAVSDGIRGGNPVTVTVEVEE